MNTTVVRDYTREMSEEEWRESRNEVTETDLEYPQTWAQSYKVLEKSSWSCETERSVFSKIRLFCSRHKVQKMQGGTMFQTFEWCFPNPLYQPKKRSRTPPGSTQKIPNIWNTKLHNPNAKSQWIRRWLMVSPSLWHIQHQPASWYPRRMRLSAVKIRPQEADQAKKATLLGAWTPQIALHGKVTGWLSLKAK